ncbi:MAG: selenide, water dikinase SelD [Planctomycetes bacterium]|nr:selenide, water dikinase SelD [Planctomycetota bacterium]
MLRDLPAFSDPNLLVGADHFSDAGVYKLRDDLAIVQTTDFFPPLVDDPFTFGQIAAANSLSDCYAMGATPKTCLNIVAFPDKDLPIEILGDILAGGANKIIEAGAVILGGHSVRDAEIKYGLAVTGVVHPDHFFSNDRARPGDRLLLTKPIGSGIMASAAKNEKISESVFAEAVAVMTQLNAGAAALARAAGAHAVTDITGFGLVGHAFQMADASGVSFEIRASSVPLIGPTRELADQGIVTRAWKSTVESIGSAFRADGVDETLMKILADAQTSGGLLIAVAADHVDLARCEAKAQGVTVWEIGQVLPRSDVTLRLAP